MKNLLMGSIILFLFSASVLFVQTSCSKTTAQTNNTTTQLNKIAFTRNFGPAAEIWIANYDGSNPVRVPVTLPPNCQINNNTPFFGLSVSPDGQKIFFTGSTDMSNGPYYSQIYSCNIDGSNLTTVVSGSPDNITRVVAF